MSCGTRFVLFWFAALVPPAKEDDLEYYAVLGLGDSSSKKCSNQDIRKAYKKKSLSLHPDKILQRGGNPEDFRQEYQDIQEAHEVLSDDKKRQKYNLVGKSRTRYQFLTDDDAVVGAYENLVSSTCEQKSRLVLLVALLLALVLLQPIIICVKINQDLNGNGLLENADWILILIPWWIMNAFYLISLFLLLLFSACNLIMLAKFAETSCFILWQILLALRWDDYLTADYALLFTPLYLALMIRWLGRYLTMRQMASDVLRMTTPEILEHECGKPYADFTEEEQEQVARDFIIVHLPPDAAAALDDVEDVVQLSPEYEAAMQIYSNSFAALVVGMLFGIPLVILLVLKVDGHYDGSWWIIFLPVWVYLGTQILWNCYSCCCASIVGEEVILHMDVDDVADADDDDKNEVSDAGFVDPKSPVHQFNEKKAETNEPRKAEKKEQTEAAAVTATPTATARDNTPPAAAAAAAVHTKDASPDVIEEDDAPDEEDYAEYQEAFEQAEANAMDAQAKSGSAICGLLFQLTIACLIVGKLEAADGDDDDESDTDVGYSAIWIIFPFLLIAGCLLCLWACLIYGAGQEGLDQLVERAAGGGEGGDDDDEKEGDEEAPIIVVPPPSAAATPATAAALTADQIPPPAAAEGYDDGLD